MKLEINHKNTEEHTKTWKLNNMLLNNEWVNNEIRDEIERYLQTNKNEDTTAPNLWDTGSNPKREIPSMTGLSQETRKSSVN